MFNRRQLRGHKKSVLCVDASEGGRLVVSGSEDCSARLWDLRTDRAVKCFAGCFNNNAIDSVAFVPTQSTSHAPAELVLASGSDVFIFDLRKEGVIDRIPRSISRLALLGEEECDINSISIHPKGHLLAAALDDGTVKQVNLTSLRNRDTGTGIGIGAGATADIHPVPTTDFISSLRGSHTNVASSVCFRSQPLSSTELMSGGFDCAVQLWDANTGRNKGSRTFGGAMSEVASTMLNPPFVYSLTYINSGRAILCGTGDGALQIVHASSLAILDREEAHSGFVACIHVSNMKSGAAQVAFSGGNDSVVHAWRVSESTKTKVGGKNKSKSKSKAGGAGDGLGTIDTDVMKLQSLWTLAHGRKINAITTLAGSEVRAANMAAAASVSEEKDEKNPVFDDNDEVEVELDAASASSNFALVVADVSSDLSVYSYT